MTTHSNTLTRIFFALALLLALGSCSDETPSGSTDGGGVDGGVTDEGGGDGEGDGGVTDQGGSDGEGDGGVTDGGGDGGPTDGEGDGGDEGDAGPAEGEFGWPCQLNSECISGYCLEGYDGKVCSTTCQGDCPTGWACQQDLAAFPDVIFVCVPAFQTICFPCDTNAECLLPGEENFAHACIPNGDDGSFCGGDCSSTACPSGYVCSVVTDIEGGSSQQCVPAPMPNGDPGQCECSPAAIAAAADTTCYLTNELGSCPGGRQCTTDGLTACDAEPPEVDLCDGADNDCDGETDEDAQLEECSESNDFGTCEGTIVCFGVDGGICDAPVPAPEVCDGSDNNCDGETDEAGAEGCTDYWLDADGDGFGVGDPLCLCGPTDDYTATQAGDCDDEAGNVNPDADEICNDVDDDCDSDVDEEGALGCSLFNLDGDTDGFGHPTDAKCLCEPVDEYTAKSNTDCDDEDPEANPGTSEICDGKDNDCDGVTDEEGAGNCVLYFADGDGDNYGDPANFACLCGPTPEYGSDTGGDCDDGNALISPGQDELCDGVDNDCDGITDESGAADCTTYFKDNDKDEFGIDGDSQCLCAPSPPYTSTAGGDCNDASAIVNPNALEICNGLDDNCDGLTDEENAGGCTVYYLDSDFDGYGVPDDEACLCAPKVPYQSTNTDDCDNSDPFVNPGASEVCNGVDDDCNGETDEGVTGSCTPFYLDLDSDGWGQDGESQCLCGPEGDYKAVKAGDCDDDNPLIFPFAQEVCNAGIDDDCDGEIDEIGAQGCTTFYKDGDADDYGVLGDFQCLCAPAGQYTAPNSGDCNDGDAAISPGVNEACNGFDDDCDALVDEIDADGCTVYLRDSDLDGYGVDGETQCLCAPTTPYSATQGGDCNDSSGIINPGQTEVCNGLDDDCSGAADDPGTAGCVNFYADGDGDAWGVGTPQCLCGPSGSFTTTSVGDCDDLNSSVSPSAIEQCNLLDDDCDADTDEPGALGCVTYFSDGDDDTFGVGSDKQCLCAAADPYDATAAGDCNDVDPLVSPAATEACNGVDDDCDGAVDEQGADGCTIYLRDGDGDGFGVDGDQRCLCAPSAPYQALQGGDCNDGNAALNPGATEVCNGLDDDCNGQQDDPGTTGCIDYYLDADGDTWGVAGDSQCLCAPSGDYTAVSFGDCDDAVAGVNPAATEACNGFDDDCDAAIDELGAAGCTVYLRDEDLDDYGVNGDFQCLCAPDPIYDALVGGDCNDTNPAVSPAGVEVCNGLDDDCNGLVDDEGGGGCVDFLKDVDGDGWGDPNDTKCLCTPSAPYQGTNAGDCNDGNPNVNPGETETCNGVDDDCDGTTDGVDVQGCVTYFLDADNDTWGVTGDSQCRCAPSGNYKATSSGDCNDGDATISPGAVELCNGIDDDCDSGTDEAGASGCTVYLKDEDFDDYGVTGDLRCLCAPDAIYDTTTGGDCDDTDPAISPVGAEICNGFDDDCDGQTDEAGAAGCSQFFKDADGDTYGVTGDTQCLCAAVAPYAGTQGGDCADGDPAINPGASEVCNGFDDDCNGTTDGAEATDCIDYYLDGDGDTWGLSTDSVCACAPSGQYTTTNPGDCNDGVAAVNPAAIEQCNGVNDDCDLDTDEAGSSGCTIYLKDEDGDDYGVTGDFRCLCSPSAIYDTVTGGDCDDTNGALSPGQPEACNGFDDNCNGSVDEEGATGCTVYLKDTDGDGYGVTGNSKCLCAPAAPYTAPEAMGGDCNDSTTLINPAATEFCNGTDDNCDGEIDEEDSTGCINHYNDVDGDGWGVGTPRCLCGPDGSYTALKAPDCDDAVGAKNPDQLEQCDVGTPIDNDCDGVTDEANAVGCTTFFQDVDGDGFGTDASAVCLCAAPPGYVAQGGDCNDVLPGGQNQNPGQAEICNSVDDNCAGGIDEGCGLATSGWPTYKYDMRRTGMRKDVEGPTNNNLRWSVDLGNEGIQLEGSPVITPDGNVAILWNDVVYKLAASNGAVLWQRTLNDAFTNTCPQGNGACIQRAGVTVREGGSMYVPTNDGITMLSSDGDILWYTDFGDDALEYTISSPTVDDAGNAYLGTNFGFYKINPAGEIEWKLFVPNYQDTPMDAAWGPNTGRLYFSSTNHVVYAVEPTGFVAWTFIDIGKDIDGSVAIGKTGAIYSPFGDFMVGITDDGDVGTEFARYDMNVDTDTSASIWNDGADGVSGNDFVFGSPNGNSGVYKFDANLNVVWNHSLQKGQGRGSTPVFDADGDVYMGTHDGTFECFDQDDNTVWVFNTIGNNDIDGHGAIGNGFVVFPDDNGNLYLVGP